MSIIENSGAQALKFSPSAATLWRDLAGDRRANGEFGHVDIALVQGGLCLLHLGCRERALFLAGTRCRKLQCGFRGLALADRQLEIAGDLIDPGLRRVTGAGQLCLPFVGLLTERLIGLGRVKIRLARSDCLGTSAVDPIEIGLGHGKGGLRRKPRCDQLRAFQFGHHGSPLYGVANVDLQRDNPARDPWADVDPIRRNFSLDGQRRRPRRKPEHCAKRHNDNRRDQRANRRLAHNEYFQITL